MAACNDYQIDMTAAAFGQCKCGYPKSAHSLTQGLRKKSGSGGTSTAEAPPE
jgi:hypothetical protein